MEKISQDQFFAKIASLPQDVPINLYLDFPFCHQTCKYCIFHSIEATCTSDAVVRYYQFMRDSLDRLSGMSLPPIESLFIGGGTVNFMPADYMREVFSHMTFLDKVKSTNIECHPAYLTDKWIKLIQDLRFTKVSIGVQSTFPEVLQLNNRLGVSRERLKFLIDVFQDSGIYVSIDLLAYISSMSLDNFVPDLERFSEDLRRIAELSPHVIYSYAERKSMLYHGVQEAKLRDYHRAVHDFALASDYTLVSPDITENHYSVKVGIELRNAAILARRDIATDDLDWLFSYKAPVIKDFQPLLDTIAIGGLRGKVSAYGVIGGIPYRSRMDTNGDYHILWNDTSG